MRTTLMSCLCAALCLGCGAGATPEVGSTGTSTGTSPASDGVSETGGGETTQSPTTSSESSMTTGTASTSSSSSEDSGGFIITPDGGGGTVECDVYAQECEDGMKCMPYAEGGGSSWNASKCVPVTGDQQPGEPCIAEGGGVSGLDDCIEGAMCWDVDAMNKGTCIEMCHGTAEMPLCSELKSGCAQAADGVLNICLPYCEPLIQDCPGDDLCLPIGGGYVCVLDASGETMGAAFDPCEYANACDQGLVCLPPQSASECDPKASGCCLPMCSIAEGAVACPGVGQQCFPMYEPQTPGFEDIGYCSLMPLLEGP